MNSLVLTQLKRITHYCIKEHLSNPGKIKKGLWAKVSRADNGAGGVRDHIPGGNET